jgi:hypothetical protein
MKTNILAFLVLLLAACKSEAPKDAAATAKRLTLQSLLHRQNLQMRNMLKPGGMYAAFSK